MKKKIIYPPKLLYGMMALLLWCSSAPAQGLIIGSGTYLVSEGFPNIVLSNTHWTNNGTFVPAYSRVYMNETSKHGGNYFLRGDSSTTFYHLLVTTFPTAVLTVQTNAYIIARFDFSGHMASVGDADINLLPGAVLGDPSQGRLAGNNGRIITTVMLDKPQRANPGNLGLEITSNENLGMTTIIRGFREQINTAGEKSIERYYDIIPSHQPSFPVQLKFQYAEAELNGNSRNGLAVFSGKPGGRLSMLPHNNREERTNWIDAGSVRQLQRFTLANAVAANQPEAEKVGLKAYPNPFTNHFTVTIHSDVARSVELKMINPAGVIVDRKMVNLQPGNNYVVWPGTKYTPGTWHLVIGGDLGKAIKIVKQ
jgi:hypothetical protein